VGPARIKPGRRVCLLAACLCFPLSWARAQQYPTPWFIPAVLPVVRSWASESQAPNGPEHTHDGRLDTRWSAAGKGVWIAYELAGLATISEVRVAWSMQPPRQTQFLVEFSSDGVEWRLVFVGQGAGATAQPESFLVLGPPARFVRLTGFGSTLSPWTSITEVELRGVPIP
jgi:F5/8 type C domain